MKHFPILLGALALSLSSSGEAARRAVLSAADSRIVGSITESDLAALVRAEGHTIDATHPFEAPSVRGKTKEGLIYVLIGTACDKDGIPGCRGIMMQVRYDSDEEVTTAKINKAAMAQAALGSWWDEDGKTVGFTRYVVLDDGVTWMNIRQNLRVLLSIQEHARAIVFD